MLNGPVSVRRPSSAVTSSVDEAFLTPGGSMRSDHDVTRRLATVCPNSATSRRRGQWRCGLHVAHSHTHTHLLRLLQPPSELTSLLSSVATDNNKRCLCTRKQHNAMPCRRTGSINCSRDWADCYFNDRLLLDDCHLQWRITKSILLINLFNRPTGANPHC